MDKYEYKVRSEEISNLIEQEKYTEAVKIADTIDWRRVKSASMLLKISVLYRINRRNEEAREVLMLAYERYPANRSVVYSLCELSIELDDVVSAIEYYKQFVKLAPKDNGVFTLRYRILEAQEASLEERIEILEELKKKDYQEEWAYELAYLYHRVGLSTKCVEECDDIILWFGDGPYVMKAMELKAVHVPLSRSQQEKYETMLNHASDNYSGDTEVQEMYSEEEYGVDNIAYYPNQYTEEAYEDTGYEQENYSQELYDNTGYDSQSYPNRSYENSGYDAQNYVNESYQNTGYDTQNYPNEGYETTNYNTQGYPNEGYDNISYDTQNYPSEGYKNSSYDTQAYSNGGYETTSYDTQNYPNETYQTTDYNAQGYPNEEYANTGYDTQSYPNETYENSGYNEQTYSNEGYENSGYNAQGYPSEGYENTQYSQETYASEPYNIATYAQETYSDYGQNDYVEDGYGNINYTNKSSYTGEFYVEQTYDENGNLIENRTDTNNQEIAGRGGESDKSYRNGLYLYQSNPAPAANLGDMSEYNTINLQKLVAEGMREFLADNEDVFAEDREKYNSSEDVDNIARHTQAYTNVQNSGGEASEGMAYTSSIAQLVTSVSEAPPAPNTGAIRKVYVPGKDARFIKSDSDIEELRDTTEQTVNEEHNRMEDNAENVYHDQNTMEISGELGTQVTGTMNLKDVLAEWERKKTENAKKHQEEIKKRVLTQTGKILADFNNSLKSGILGEIQREEEAAQRRIPRKDRFLEADVTGDIPQNRTRQASDDAFDVEYRTAQTERKEEASVVQEEYQPEFENTELETPLEPTALPQEIKAESDVNCLPQADQETWESDENYATEGDFDSKDAYMAEEDLESSTAYLPEQNIENSAAQIPEQNAEVSVEYTQEINTEDYLPEDNNELENGYLGENDIAEIQADLQDINTEEDSYYEESNNDYLPEEDGDSPDNLDVESDGDEYNNTYALEENPIEEMTEDYSGTQEIYSYDDSNEYVQESNGEMEIEYADYGYAEESSGYTQELYSEETHPVSDKGGYIQNYQYDESELDPEDAESIAEMAKEDALKTQEIKMNTADLSSLSEKIVATTKKEAHGAKREELREFTAEEQTLFENFAVTKKIKKQIIFALENMTLAAYTGNVIITGDAGLDTVRMAKNLIKEYQVSDESFSGRLAKITGEKINQRNIKDVFEKLNNGGIIIEKANGMSEEKLYEMALNLNQENFGIVVIMEDTKKEISKLLQKQAMIADYFNIRIDLMEMDNNALVAYAKNYALALEYSIDELGTLALYTRIANMQSGNHVVTKDEVRDIIDEAIWKSRKSKLKNFVDVLFARRYDNEDMIVLKERDFI